MLKRSIVALAMLTLGATAGHAQAPKRPTIKVDSARFEALINRLYAAEKRVKELEKGDSADEAADAAHEEEHDRICHDLVEGFMWKDSTGQRRYGEAVTDGIKRQSHAIDALLGSPFNKPKLSGSDAGLLRSIGTILLDYAAEIESACEH